MTNTLTQLANELRTGRTSAEELLDGCLARIDEPSGEGERVMLTVSRETARAAARAADMRLAAGLPSEPLTGIPISIKDLFDVAGEITRAGSTILSDAPPAELDAPVVARLRTAGAVFVGRTNMTEFAYSGVGINPHYGTPLNPYDRQTRRIPGGSSSGAAVSVTDGMAAVAIGTDTGGSCRIPAALCGLVGFKPTAKRIPLQGVLPLSASYDSIGSLGHSVRCVALMDAVMAGEPPVPLDPYPLAGLRLALVENIVLNELDDAVSTHFFNAITKLADAGARIDRVKINTLDELPVLGQKGGIVAAEAFAWHRELLAEQGDAFDPRVKARIMVGQKQSAADYIGLLQARRHLQTKFIKETRQYDALIMPTVPKVAPPLAAFDRDEEFMALNGLLLRNTAIANTLDLCAISLPCQPKGELPVGLGLFGKHLGDRRLLEMAASIEQLIG